MQVPSKLLLFGEFTILLGGEALVIPLNKFSGQLVMPSGEKTRQPDQQLSNTELSRYLQFLETNKALFPYINFDQLQNDVRKGLFFDSTIPYGYGVGSSGSLCAAIFLNYLNNKYAETEEFLSLANLRDKFSQLESFFHGESSGIDPLTCYINKPVYFSNGEVNDVEGNNLFATNQSWFLIDSGIRSETSLMVDKFLDNMQKVKFRREMQRMINQVEKTLKTFIQADNNRFAANFKDLSFLQFKLFGKSIPFEIFKIWKESLNRSDFSMKLCGSGGGGFYLGLAYDEEGSKEFLQKHSLSAVWL